ncbi:molybdopterin-dependent oxidoreductase [Aeromicrobium sp. CF3.5]|uniref:molybdopterin-dependent oxidoreductase n=1 Tax=Aeromicrobium sp. CF3.5 TaxID=3373078 RepID=UPI003EE7656D
MRFPRVEDIEARIPRPEHFDQNRRGTPTTSRVGTALGIAFGICFLTGMWSHFQYTNPAWLPIGPDPAWLYRWTQGLHIVSGTAAVPLLLVKLWSVFPRFFERPPALSDKRALVLEGLSRLSIAALVASAIFLLATGTLNIAGWYPWDFSFRRTHEAVAWIAIGSLIVHIAVKLPQIKQGLGTPVDHVEDSADHVEDDHDDTPPSGTSRRAVLGATGAASGLAVVLTAGQTIPFLRQLSVFSVRDGEGPQDLPINRTASGAGAIPGATSPDFVLEIVAGDQTTSLSLEDLRALPQSTHTLPIACVEGWSRSAEWTGVAVRDLIALVGAAPRSTVQFRSTQTRGAFGSSELPSQFVADERTLLALKLNGQTLSLDHGFPCRLIAPNRPGVLQTKWVQRIEVV